MFSRNTVLVSIVLIFLSGMFLMGQDPWPTCTDLDGDGYGNPASAACTHPELDCDDAYEDVYPGAPEICDDGIDNQCPGDPDYGEIDNCPYVFLTYTELDGDLGGLDGADLLCNFEAAVAGLPGTYKAWLSDGVNSPATRFTRQDATYQLVDGTIIANDWADLVDGNIHNPINLDAAGVYHTRAFPGVWTSTLADGTTAGLHCQGWTTAGEGIFGRDGHADRVDGFWTDAGYPACPNQLPFYCFEQ